MYCWSWTAIQSHHGYQVLLVFYKENVIYTVNLSHWSSIILACVVIWFYPRVDCSSLFVSSGQVLSMWIWATSRVGPLATFYSFFTYKIILPYSAQTSGFHAGLPETLGFIEPRSGVPQNTVTTRPVTFTVGSYFRLLEDTLQSNNHIWAKL